MSVSSAGEVAVNAEAEGAGLLGGGVAVSSAGEGAARGIGMQVPAKIEVHRGGDAW